MNQCREEHIACGQSLITVGSREQQRDRMRMMPRGGEHRDRDLTEAQRLPCLKHSLWGMLNVRPEAGPEVVVNVRQNGCVAGARVDWARSRRGDRADRSDVIQVGVRDEDRAAREAEVGQRGQDALWLLTGIDHEAIGRSFSANQIAVRPVGTE